MKSEDLHLTIIGSIDFDDIGNCDIIIYPYEEEKIPHVHIKSNNLSFETTVAIYESQYLGGDKLNAYQKDKLNEWMNGLSKDGLQNNIICRIMWCGKNGEDNCKDLCPIPDYTKLV